MVFPYLKFAIITLGCLAINVYLAFKIKKQRELVRRGYPPSHFVCGTETLSAISWVASVVLGIISALLLSKKGLTNATSIKAVVPIVVIALGFPGSLKRILRTPPEPGLLPYFYIILYFIIFGLIIIDYGA